MSSLLLRNLRSVITCDDGDTVLEHTDLYCEDGVIRAMGPDLPQTADTVMDGSRYWCYPGLINTHHHLYQVFSRNLPQVQNLDCSTGSPPCMRSGRGWTRTWCASAPSLAWASC